MNAPLIRAYLAPGSAHDMERQRRAIAAYVEGKGFDPLKSEGYIATLETTDIMPAKSILILPDLAALGSYPTIIEQAINSFIGRGVSVHVLSLGGPAEMHLLAIREALAATGKLEAENAKLRDTLQKQSASHAKEMELFERELMGAVIAKYGLPQNERLLPDFKAKQENPA